MLTSSANEGVIRATISPTTLMKSTNKQALPITKEPKGEHSLQFTDNLDNF